MTTAFDAKVQQDEDFPGDRMPGSRRSKAAGSLKYRSSCDACQNAKVKCGQEKVSCQRCVAHGIECVYSRSRRMGRPRKTLKPASPTNQPKGKGVNSRTSSNTPEAEQNQKDDVATSIEVLMNMGDTESSSSGSQHEEAIQLDEPGATSISADSPLGDNLTNQSEIQFTRKDLDFDASQQWDMQQLDFLSNNIFDLSAYPELTGETSLSQTRGNIFSTEPSQFSGQFSNSTSNINNHSKELHQRTNSMEMKTANSSISALNLQSPPREDFRMDFGHDLAAGSRGSVSAGFSGEETTSQEPSMNSPSSFQSGLQFQLGFFMSSGDSTPTASTRKDSQPHSLKRPLSHGQVCACYSTIFRTLTASNSEQWESGSIPVDMVLNIENEMQKMLSQLKECRVCSRNQTALLLSFIGANQTFHLLEKTAHTELKPQRRGTSLSGRDGSGRGARRGRSESSSLKSISLLVGKFEVTEEGRSRFLRKILQARFSKLAAILRCLHSKSGAVPQDSTSRAGSLIVMDIFQELQTIAGRLELWD